MVNGVLGHALSGMENHTLGSCSLGGHHPLCASKEARLGDWCGDGVLAVAGGCHSDLTLGPFRGRS